VTDWDQHTHPDGVRTYYDVARDLWQVADGSGWWPGVYADEAAALLARELAHELGAAWISRVTQRDEPAAYRPVTVAELESWRTLERAGKSGETEPPRCPRCGGTGHDGVVEMRRWGQEDPVSTRPENRCPGYKCVARGSACPGHVSKHQICDGAPVDLYQLLAQPVQFARLDENGRPILRPGDDEVGNGLALTDVGWLAGGGLAAPAGDEAQLRSWASDPIRTAVTGRTFEVKIDRSDLLQRWLHWPTSQAVDEAIPAELAALMPAGGDVVERIIMFIERPDGVPEGVPWWSMAAYGSPRIGTPIDVRLGEHTFGHPERPFIVTAVDPVDDGERMRVVAQR
jgi:hypothetical protein